MDSSLGLIVMIVGGYLAAHVAFGWLARRFNVVSGAEYLLLGILLGPQVSGLIGTGAVGGFAPLLTLALGWIGVLVGAQFYLPELMRISARQYRIAFAEAILCLAAVTAVMGGVLYAIFREVTLEVLAPAVVMGSMATATSPTGIGLVARRLGRFGPVVRQLQLNTAIDSVIAIVAFALLLTVDHAPPSGTVRPLTATEWAVVAIGIGFVGGALFHLFLGEERKIDRLFIALAGAIILTSGAAAYLRLSPLLPSLLVGMILVNTSRSRLEIKHVLSLVERPIYFVLLIFAGAAWQPSSEAWLLPVLAFLLARALAKTGSAMFAAWANDALSYLGPGWGRALLGQGGLAIAIALNYQIQERSILANMVSTAAILSILLTDVTGARVAEAVVRAARERLRLANVAELQTSASASSREG